MIWASTFRPATDKPFLIDYAMEENESVTCFFVCPGTQYLYTHWQSLFTINLGQSMQYLWSTPNVPARNNWMTCWSTCWTVGERDWWFDNPSQNMSALVHILCSRSRSSMMLRLVKLVLWKQIIWTYMHTCTSVHAHTHILIHTGAHKHVHPYTHMHTHAHPHAHTHTLTHPHFNSAELTHPPAHSLAHPHTHSLTHSLTAFCLLTTHCGRHICDLDIDE